MTSLESAIKAAEAFSLRDQFETIDSERRDYKLKRLISIIVRHAMTGVCVSVSSDPFKRIMQGWMSAEYLDRPYFLLFHEIIVQSTWCAEQNNLDGKIDFVFDVQGDEPLAMADFVAQFHHFAASAPDSAKRFLGDPPSFKNEEEARPIQAADLLAWWTRRVLEEKPYNPLLDSLLNVPTFISRLDEKRLQGSARRVLEARLNEGE